MEIGNVERKSAPILDNVKRLNDNPETHTSIAFKNHILEKFKNSEEIHNWNAKIIMHFLTKALEKGYHGFHFISDGYLCCVDDILKHYLGDDHYMAYRHCKIHHKIILLPDYNRLGVRPMDYLRESYTTSPKMFPYTETAMASFCFE